jgi:5,6-dimethylbenzimidazole synthase
MHRFDVAERMAIYRVIAARRDMRHFKPDPIAPVVMARLFAAAHQAPSVGLMQPWRFIRITDTALRTRIHALVDSERLATARALEQREDEFLRLKVDGVRECAEVIVVALTDRREPHIFGRRTMPHMDIASVACAIQNLWLAARAENLGMGWVSLFEPQALAQLLNMPSDAEPIAILCLGHVDEFYPAPMLQMEQWREPDPLARCVMENKWALSE